MLGAALRGIIAALPDDGRALIVGHSPTNEAVFRLLPNVTWPGRFLIKFLHCRRTDT